MDAVIIFPEYDMLKKDIEKLKTELSMLTLEYDNLRLIECRNIEMSYMLELGAIEYRAYELECTYLRLKRKLEIMQMLINIQEKMILADIEIALDEKFKEYKEKLDEKIGKMNEAISRSKLQTLSEDETAELKKLYRQIVKALHPDLHPDISEEQINLFIKATAAFENGNLFEMRLIAEMVASSEFTDISENNMDQLIKEKDRLYNLIQNIINQIQLVKQSYPYILKALLDDKEKLKERKVALKEVIKQYEEAISLYKERIKKAEEKYNKE